MGPTEWPRRGRTAETKEECRLAHAVDHVADGPPAGPRRRTDARCAEKKEAQVVQEEEIPGEEMQASTMLGVGEVAMAYTHLTS